MDEWLLGKAEWKTIQFPSSFIKLHILSHPYLIIQSDDIILSIIHSSGQYFVINFLS